MLQNKVGFNLKNTLSLEITDNLLGILLEDESGAEHNLVHQLGQGELVRLNQEVECTKLDVNYTQTCSKKRYLLRDYY